MALLALDSDLSNHQHSKRFFLSRSDVSWALRLGQGRSLLVEKHGRRYLREKYLDSSQPQDIAHLPDGFRAIASGAFSETLYNILTDHTSFLSLLEKGDYGQLTPEEIQYLMDYKCSPDMERVATYILNTSSLFETCVGLALMVTMLTIFHGYGIGRLWLQLRKDLVTAVTAASRVILAEWQPCLLWCKAVAIASCTNSAGLDELGLMVATSFTEYEMQFMESWSDLRNFLRCFLWPKQMDLYARRGWHEATIGLWKPKSDVNLRFPHRYPNHGLTTVVTSLEHESPNAVEISLTPIKSQECKT
jgi:hypothetical protein